MGEKTNGPSSHSPDREEGVMEVLEVEGAAARGTLDKKSSAVSDVPLMGQRKGSDASDPEPPFPWGVFIFCYLGWLFDFMDLVLVSVLKQVISKAFKLNERTESWMLGVSLGTSGFGGIAAGALADVYGKRHVLSATILIYSLGSLVCGLAPNYGVFLLGRGMVGLGVGGEWAVGHAMLAEVIGRRHRAVGSSMLQSGEPVGMLLAAIAGFYIEPIIGWRNIMLSLSATAMLGIAVRYTLVLPNTPMNHHVHCGKLLLQPMWRVFAAFFLAVLKLGTYWTCYTWLPTFLHKHMHQSVGKSFQWIAISQVGQFVGMIIFGRYADFVGRRPAFTSYGLLTAGAVACLAFRWPYLAANPNLFWTVMFCLGLGSGCTGGLGALMAELFPTEIRTVAMGTAYNCARAVQVISPYVVTLALESNGLQGALSVPMGLALAMSAWVWVFPETKNIRLPEWEEEVEVEYTQTGVCDDGRRGGLDRSV